MSAALDKLCIHTFTNRPWSATECIENYARAGVGGITWWQETVEGHDLAQLKQQALDAGLANVALARGGFFPHTTAEGRAGDRNQ